MELSQEFKAYADLTEAIKALEDERAGVGKILFEQMKTDGTDKIQADFGTFSLVNTTKYMFTDAVKCLEDSLKTLKEKEKSEGVAKSETTQVLRFQLAK